MSGIEVSLEVLRIVIINETFDGLDIDHKTEKVLEIFTKIHTRIQEIDSSSVEKKKSSSPTQGDSDKNSDNRDNRPTDSGKNGDSKDKSTTASTGKNGDKD